MGGGRRAKKKIDWMIKLNKRMQGINANSGLLIKYGEEYWVSEVIDMFFLEHLVYIFNKIPLSI